MKKFISILLLGAMSLSLAACSTADSDSSSLSSSGTIRIICPYGVGGTADLIARKYALVAGSLFPDKTFIVENMTGGDGFSAATYYSELNPSTTDLLIYGLGVVYRHDLGTLYGTEIVDFDRNEILPIGVIDDRTWILYGTPGTTFEEVLELAQTTGVKMSGGNALSDPHLALGSLMALEDGKVIVIPYDGGASQKKALTDGEVNVFVGTTQAAQEEVEAGTLVPILSFSEEPFEGFIGPDGNPIEVPSVGGAYKHTALNPGIDHTVAILPSGGFIATRVGASEEWIAEMEEVTKAVWASDEYSDWIEGIMLNKTEAYGLDAVQYLEEASEVAINAFEILSQ
ncbi:MAG: hypothetical protein ATN33_00770 [Epulopiscium sp. Nele67-Bin001]|nr:MAG: hypothetical protein ATN33_00770 [Epulopiscium sp. Nele67-Bin001]